METMIIDLPAGSHLCFLHRTVEEYQSFFLPVIKRVLKKKEKIIYVVESGRVDSVLKYLSENDVDVESLIGGGHLALITSEEVYCRHGVFDPDTLIHLIEGETEKAPVGGFTALIGIIDMTSLMRGVQITQTWFDYEIKMNTFLRNSAFVQICLYDQERLESECLLNVLMTHPTVVIGNDIYDNPFFISAEDFQAADAKEAMLQLIVRSLSGQKQAEKEINESEARYRSLVDHAPEAIAVHSNGRFVFVNPMGMKLIGAVNPEDILGKSLFSFLHPDYHETIHRRIELLNQGADLPPIEVKAFRMDGTTIDVEISVMPFLYDGKPSFQIVVRDINEKKNAAEALRESERRYRTIFENTGNATIIVEDDMTIIMANREIERLTGYSKDEIEGRRKWTEFVVPQDLEKIMKHHRSRRSEAEGSPGAYEFRLVDRWGRVRSIINNVVKIPGTTRSVASLIDITELKEAEEALKESERQLADIIEFLPDATFVIDHVGTVIAWNRALEAMTGVKAEEMLGKGNYEYALPFYGERRPILIDLVLTSRNDLLETYKDVERQGNILVGEVYIPSLRGKEAYLMGTASALHDSRGNIIGAIESIRDVTEQKMSEKYLQESEEKYRLLVENSTDGILIAQDDVIKFPNPTTLKILGYSADELADIPFTSIIHPEDRDVVYDLYRRRLNGENVISPYAFRAITKNNEELWLEISHVVVAWEDHSAALCFIRDITHQKKLELKLQEAQKMEAIGTLAGGIAHDFNNILMSIQGYVSLVLLDRDVGYAGRQKLHNIEDQVQSGASLTRQLLGFARGGKYEVKTTDLNEIISRSATMFGRTKKEIQLHLKLSKELRPVDVDRSQIEQVFMNLYVNAGQAMSAGGDLSIETHNIDIDENFIRPYRVEPGAYIKISVTDTGVGMDERTRDRIFEPFFTTKAMGRGVGLGLASVYGIIKGHKGMIDVTSELGNGTTFHIYLPVSKGTIIREEIHQEEIIRGSETILLVDDEEAVLDVNREILEMLGYTVVSARNGMEAIDIYKKDKDRIEVVLLDMIMPGMSGGEVYDVLKEIDPVVKVILLSGYSIDGRATKILEKGCQAFLQKPFNVADLSGKVRKIIDLK